MRPAWFRVSRPVRPMGRILRKTVMALFAGLVAAGAAPAPAGGQVPPHIPWQTLATEHFRITFPPGLEAVARHVADRAEVARARLAEELGAPPQGVVDIVITDHVDDSNGFARVFPTNRIVLYARPPVDHLALAFAPDWIDMLVVHELTHIVHGDLTGTPGSILRQLLGRAPIIWPVFPAAATPQWSIEGLATYFESRFTGAGRTYGSIHDMMVRADVLEGRFAEIDEVSGYSPEWPGGQRWYVYGSLFYDYVARTRGVEALRELAARTARAWIPPTLAFDRVARRGIGASFTELWAEWREHLQRRYAALADSLRAEGLTEGEALTTEGRYVLYPRAAAGGRVAYAVEDGRSDPGTRLLDAATRERRSLGRRNGLATLAWFPGGDSLLVAQREFSDRYHVFGDLYVVDGRGKERRITRGARLSEPDVAPDGVRAVAVQTEAGATRLVLVELATGAVEPITAYDLAVGWSAPRWSPSGDYIAAARWRLGGEYDVVILAPDGRVVRELTRDRAIDGAPAWSPDGRYVLFWSDRSGIPNLYAYDVTARAAADGDTARLFQITNTLTGAFYPDVDPDGRWIYYVGYRSDGYRLERIPYDPARWRPASPLRPELAMEAGSAPPAGVRAALPVEGGREGPDQTVEPYSAARTLLPRYWLPTWTDEGVAGRFIGVTTYGEDVVGRHAFDAWVGRDVDRPRFAGAFHYRYAGLGNPVLTFGLARDWDRIGRVRLEDQSTRDVIERETVVQVGTSFARRRWRSIATFDLGVEDVRRHREILNGTGLRLADPQDAMTGVYVRAAYGTARSRTMSISREAGLSAAVGVRRRWERDPAPDLDRSYSEATGLLTAFQPIPAFGHANHVLALRASGLWRGGDGAGISDIGGASGSAVDLGVASLGASRFLPVRGFPVGARSGTRAWSATLEYRLPIALIGRGYRVLPFNVDRLSAALFLDAGNAWCSPEIQERSSLCTPPEGPGAAGPFDPAPLVGAGAELALDLSVLFSAPTRLRAGVGFPVQGPTSEPAFYFQFGAGF